MADGVIKQRIALEGVQEIQKQLSDLGASGEQAAKIMKSALERVDLGKPAAELQRVGSVLQQVGDKFKEFGGQSIAALQPLLALAGRFGPFGIALAGIAAGMSAIAKSTAENVVEQDKLATGLGLTIAQYQALGKAAREAGVEQETLNKGLTRFVRQTDTEARTQQGALVDLTKQIVTGTGSPTGTSRDFISNLAKMKASVAPILPQIRSMLRQAESPEHETLGTAGGDQVSVFRPGSLSSIANRSDTSLIDYIARRAMHDPAMRANIDKLGGLTPAPSPLEALDQIKTRAGPGLANLGINLLNDQGKQGTTIDNLLKYADAISKIKDPTEQLKRVFDVFGRQSPQFVELLKGGLRNLPDILHELEKSGTIIKPEEVERAHQLHKELLNTEETLERLKRHAGDHASGLTGIAIRGADNLLTMAENTGNLTRSAIEKVNTPAETFAAGADTEGWQQMLATVQQSANAAWDSIKQYAAGAWEEIQTAAGAVWERIRSGIQAIGEAWTAVSEAATSAWESIEQSFNNAIEAIKNAIGSLANIWDIVVDAASGAWDAILKSALAVIDAIKRAWATVTSGGGSASGASGGPPLGEAHASGGYIRGPGSGTSDSVLARVSNGEFVMRAKAVSHYGAGFFSSLNNMRSPRFALGGLVDGMLPRFADGGMAFAGASPGHLGTIDLRTDHGPIQVMASHNTARDLQRLSVDRQVSRAGKPPSWRR